ncbi:MULTISPECIES: rod shape-determining protein MreC [Carboxydothermus]|uniref:Cell shape-determining protein MreC n=2 Tax=Carboxydothermus TaxID=129957 RepID=Q3AF78_CARHZ|nr:MULTISPECIES: rod shape-determining protein MreC [Carboxydothermus]ABB15188.1 cell shape-determining protein MreC [Carboxydothermus hydrogenoformans Z-2901]NYE57266.1 rod shape-determining protein MreC [Carboxydothermus ferrireducens DSM 11255]
MAKRYWGKTLLIGVLLAVLLLSLARYTTKQLPFFSEVKSGLKDLTYPIARAVSFLWDGVGNVTQYFKDINELRREKDRLLQENTALKYQLNRLQEVERENLRLKALLGYSREHPNFKLIVAKIIERDPASWYKSFTVNQGKSSGIRKDMPVLDQNGLVGRMMNVAALNGEVLLITDPRSSVAAVTYPGRVPGIIKGTALSSELIMDNIPLNLEVRTGEKVLTSGQGGVFPAGIPIGYVVSVTKDPSGLVQVAKVRPYVDFDRLEEVFILKGSR